MRVIGRQRVKHGFYKFCITILEKFIGNDSFRIYLAAQLSIFCTFHVGKIRVIQIPIPIHVSEILNTRRVCCKHAGEFLT